MAPSTTKATKPFSVGSSAASGTTNHQADVEPDSFAYGVPRPIIFILDREGAIKAKLYEDTYTKRPPVALLLETIDAIAKKTA